MQIPRNKIKPESVESGERRAGKARRGRRAWRPGRGPRRPSGEARASVPFVCVSCADDGGKTYPLPEGRAQTLSDLSPDASGFLLLLTAFIRSIFKRVLLIKGAGVGLALPSRLPRPRAAPGRVLTAAPPALAQDFFFYSLVYDPQQKTLLADKGEIRVGNRYQADITDLLKEGWWGPSGAARGLVGAPGPGPCAGHTIRPCWPLETVLAFGSCFHNLEKLLFSPKPPLNESAHVTPGGGTVLAATVTWRSAPLPPPGGPGWAGPLPSAGGRPVGTPVSECCSCPRPPAAPAVVCTPPPHPPPPLA